MKPRVVTAESSTNEADEPAAQPGEDEADELEELVELLVVAAVVWFTLVGASNLYWANGGTFGAWTLWGGSVELSGARESWIESLLWSIGVLTLGLAALASTIVRRSRFVPRRVVGASAFLIGLTLVPYVAVETVLQGIVWLGVLESSILDRTERAWRLLFWNPWWVLGVLLFCATAWLEQYTHDRSATEPDESS